MIIEHLSVISHNVLQEPGHINGEKNQVPQTDK